MYSIKIEFQCLYNTMEWTIAILETENIGTIGLIPTIDLYCTILYILQLDYTGNRTTFPYRQNPRIVSCFTTIIPSPPTIISEGSIVINNFVLSGEAFNLSLEWTFPLATFGFVNSSQMIILKSTENSTDEVPQDITLIDDDILVKMFHFQVNNNFR